MPEAVQLAFAPSCILPTSKLKSSSNGGILKKEIKLPRLGPLY